ncbi:hypothetical protein [Massilia sp. S19_KUP03_FR1]|uniref:hypothetical protein n=1 Tax=Massilia sp. S19_KUP03_FR1 TaxID=3025503 RepID=UPI002FCCC533
MIEPGQARLSLILARPLMLGKPEKFGGSGMADQIGQRSRVVSFFRLIPGVDDHGYIDVVSSLYGGVLACTTDCYWTSKGAWFWPLK